MLIICHSLVINSISIISLKLVSSNILHLHFSPRVLVPPEDYFILCWGFLAFCRKVPVFLIWGYHWLELLLPRQKILNAWHVHSPSQLPKVLEFTESRLRVLFLNEVLARIKTSRTWHNFPLNFLILHVRCRDFLFREREGGRIEDFSRS